MAQNGRNKKSRRSLEKELQDSNSHLSAFLRGGGDIALIEKSDRRDRSIEDPMQTQQMQNRNRKKLR